MNPRILAQRLGITTADTLPHKPRPRPEFDPHLATHIVEPVASQAVRRRRITPEERQARLELGIGVVALIGHANRVPRGFNDNEGGRGVAVKGSTDPRYVYIEDETDPHKFETGLAAIEDRQQPFDAHRMVEFTRVYVPTERHVTLFATALENVLCGTAAGARHRWRDIPASFDMDMLGFLFRQAAEDAEFDPFGTATRDRMVVDRMAKNARKVR